MKKVLHQNWISGESYQKRILDDHLKGKIDLIQDVIVKANGIIPSHSHQQTDEIFYITKNSAWMKVNGKKFRVSEGDFIYVDRNEKHGFENNSNQEFKMIVFKINFDKKDSYLDY